MNNKYTFCYNNVMMLSRPSNDASREEGDAVADLLRCFSSREEGGAVADLLIVQQGQRRRRNDDDVLFSAEI